jgi:hypothetical protein
MDGNAIEVGSRLELLVDDQLLERSVGVELRLQHPVPREVVLVHDRPWEGNTCCYHTVFRDGDVYRMYYRGSHWDEAAEQSTHAEVACYAESADGVVWRKPELGLVEFAGSRANNIVWDGYGAHNFTPFLDANPACLPSQRYKALAGSGREGLRALVAADAVNWSLLQAEPVITLGAFDSQNLAFWDSVRGVYVEYHRHFEEIDGVPMRRIMTSTSPDFVHWSTPVWVEFPGNVWEQLYTNQIGPYYRAPHLYLGFPKRFVPERRVVEPKPEGVSDGVFMSSRDGVTFRRWEEAFIRPGLQPERWYNRNNMTACGVVPTAAFLDHAPDELSLYSTEHYYHGAASKLRRFTLRMDGFVAAAGGPRGGEILTRPLVFAGGELVLNLSTSAAGAVRVEVQDDVGRPLPGLELAACEEIYGDGLEIPVRWTSGQGLAELAGRPLRFRFALRDADLFALRFR